MHPDISTGEISGKTNIHVEIRLLKKSNYWDAIVKQSS
jgi:hypothetical protein